MNYYSDMTIYEQKLEIVVSYAFRNVSRSYWLLDFTKKTLKLKLLNNVYFRICCFFENTSRFYFIFISHETGLVGSVV